MMEASTMTQTQKPVHKEDEYPEIILDNITWMCKYNDKTY